MKSTKHASEKRKSTVAATVGAAGRKRTQPVTAVGGAGSGGGKGRGRVREAVAAMTSGEPEVTKPTEENEPQEYQLHKSQ